jgi:hypothetical protein
MYRNVNIWADRHRNIDILIVRFWIFLIASLLISLIEYIVWTIKIIKNIDEIIISRMKSSSFSL